MSRFLASLVSASRRPLLLRMRADLVVRQQEYLGRRYWVVKDPLALKYYRFEEEEFAILEMLDGQVSLEELQRRFELRFAPQRITLRELHRLLGMLHQASLVLSDAAGQGRRLLRRPRAHPPGMDARCSNILSARVPVFDPDHFLARLNRWCGFFFSVPCLVLWLVMATCALLVVATQFDTFAAKLPTFQDFFASRNWLWLALALGATKVFHEFGHGLACKRFGGECHEMGVMLLVFTPCLYCNVSDSWMLPSKWRRAAIGAAGMYVELALATVCTFVWWFSHPGLLHYVCLNVMAVCSVSTLLFNANPLLRYDGYYILSDLLEIPNLRQKADAILRRKLGAWLFGLPEPPDPFLPHRRQGLFAVYSVAAGIYRWLVALAIFWFLYRVFEPYGLKVIGQAIACLGMFGLLVQPLWRLSRFIHFPGRVERVNKHRASLAGLAAIALLAAAFLVPLPHRVHCTLYLKPREAASVYVESAGAIERIHVHPGDWVEHGQPILSLANLEIQIAIERLTGERQRLESRLRSLRQRAFDDESAAMEIAEVEKAHSSVLEQLAVRERDVRKLVVVAPIAGVVIGIPGRLAPSRDSGRLPTWSGTAFVDHNLSAFLTSASPVCDIGDPNRLEAILAIGEQDVEFLRAGLPVDIFLDQSPGRPFASRIKQLSQVDMKITPSSLSSKAGGELICAPDSLGRERPLQTTYQANAWLDDRDGLMLVGATGQGKIYTRPQTLVQRFWRDVRQTFILNG